MAKPGGARVGVGLLELGVLIAHDQDDAAVPGGLADGVGVVVFAEGVDTAGFVGRGRIDQRQADGARRIDRKAGATEHRLEFWRNHGRVGAGGSDGVDGDVVSR